MLAELQTIDIGDITLTQSMIMLGVVPMIIVQLTKGLLSHFCTEMPDEIVKPLLSLVGIFVAVLMFYALAMESWMMGGIVIGLTASGGYEFTKNMAGLAKKKPIPTATTATVLMLCCMLMTSGCISQTENPRANLVASQKVFVATVDSLTVLLEADKFTAEEANEIGIFINLGGQYMTQWAASVKAGQSNPGIVQSFQVVLNKLIEYQLSKGEL